MMFRYLAIILVLFLVSGCSKTIEEGSYYILKVGDTKSNVLEKLTNNGVVEIRAGVADVYSVRKSNIEDFERLKNSRGIVFMDHKGIFSRLHFEGNKVSYVFLSLKSKSLGFDYFHEGQSRKDVFEKGLVALNETDGLVAHNIQPDNHWLNLSSITDRDKTELEEYDAWVFYGLNDLGIIEWFHSRFVVVFEGGRLKRIKHMWSFIEFP